MLFPTISFAVFFAVVLPASWLLLSRRTWWRLFMVAASWFFYGCAGWGFVPLLIGSTIVNHVFAFAIDRNEGRTRVWLARAAVVVNLGALAWFKYIGFLTSSASSLVNDLGLGLHVPLPKALLPAGISFFTFQALSYVIDVNRRKLRPVTLLDFAVYLSFFPHLLAGPIVRASEFLPQIRRRIDPRRVDAGRAIWLIAQGLFKKVVISSYLSAQAADPLFGFPHQHGGLEALFGIYAYAIQIYADFSGYTDIAIGLALLLGIRFPQNFDAPYTSRSLQEFWRRWHMTLSRWLRDYLYIPLGGNRRGHTRTYVNLMATMVLGGLWHGAAWTFVAWGALHGGGLAAGRLRSARRARRADRAGVTLPAGVGTLAHAPATLPAGEGSPVPEPVASGSARPGDGERSVLPVTSGRKVAAPRYAAPARGDGATVTATVRRPALRAVGARPAPRREVPVAVAPAAVTPAAVPPAAVPPAAVPPAGVAPAAVPPAPGGVPDDGPVPDAGDQTTTVRQVTLVLARLRDITDRVEDRWLHRVAVPPAVRSVGAWLFTFNFVCLGWVFFRATSFANALEVLGRLFASSPTHLDPVVVLVVLGSLASQWVPHRWSGGLVARFSRWRLLPQALALGIVLIVIDVWGPSGVAPFIYFRF